MKKLMSTAPSRYQNLDFEKLTIKQFEKQLPESVPKVVTEDIAYYFDYLRTGRSEAALKKWETASNCFDSPNSWKVEGYRPIFSFLYYDRITDGQFLPLLLSKLDLSYSDHEHKMTIEEFNRLCRLSIIIFRPNIDSVDLSILQVLSKEPDLVVKELTNRIEYSYVTVYQHLQKLKAKLGLRVLTRINWSKLNVENVFLISKDKTDFDYFKEFKHNLDGQATFLWGKTHYLQYYFLKLDSKKKFIEKYLETKKKVKPNLELYELEQAPIIGWGFENFNHIEQRWSFDFTSAFKQRFTQKNDSKLAKNENDDTQAPGKLTPLEIKIIDDLVGNYNLSQKELAEQIGMHAQNLSTIRLKLLRENIIYPRLDIRNFQPLSCILWCSSNKPEVIDVLVELLQRVPFSNISHVRNHSSPDKKQLVCFLFLDDILYGNLAVFLLDLLEKNHIDDFSLGLNLESYFGMAKVVNVLENGKE
jgi:DNA-binding Lrp family transcriptional regulator